jgi:hypothetical protein
LETKATLQTQEDKRCLITIGIGEAESRENPQQKDAEADLARPKGLYDDE